MADTPDINELAEQLEALDPELAQRLRDTPPWLTALLDPNYQAPTVAQLEMAARRQGRAHRQAIVMAAAAAAGETVLVVGGPDGSQLHHPDGTVEPWQPRTNGLSDIRFDEPVFAGR